MVCSLVKSVFVVFCVIQSAVDRAPRQWRIKEGADWATARGPQQIRGPQSLRW